MESKDLVASPVSDGHLPVKEIKDRVADMQRVMRDLMRPNTHYGIIPGCKKPSLWKPGAEILAMAFGICIDIEVVHADVTPEEVTYRVRATGKTRGGAFLGSAEGECSTYEKKYRWRAPVHPKEFDAHPDHLKRITYDATGLEVYQVRQEPGDLRNTFIQMGSKRALVQMIRAVCGASDVFIPEPEDDPTEADRERDQAAGDLRVVGYSSQPKKNDRGPYTLHTVTFSDRRTLKTFKDPVGKDAEQAYRLGFPVTITTELDRRGSPMLATLVKIEAPATAPTPDPEPAP